jgi:hypothetical protein
MATLSPPACRWLRLVEPRLTSPSVRETPSLPGVGWHAHVFVGMVFEAVAPPHGHETWPCHPPGNPPACRWLRLADDGGVPHRNGFVSGMRER